MVALVKSMALFEHVVLPEGQGIGAGKVPEYVMAHTLAGQCKLLSLA